MFIDIAKIKVKAGDGGDGAVSFHREKYVAAGGPDGGDGGRGGSIVFQVDDNLSTLADFRYKRKYVAQRGENGRGQSSAASPGPGHPGAQGHGGKRRGHRPGHRRPLRGRAPRSSPRGAGAAGETPTSPPPPGRCPGFLSPAPPGRSWRCSWN